MPEVPTYGGLKVSTAPIPGVRKTAAETAISTGAGLEQAKGQTGEVISAIGANVAARGTAIFSRLAEEQRQAADETALLDAETQLGKWENERLNHGDNAALGVHGKDAMDLPSTVGAEFDAKASDIATKLTSDKQRAAFARSRANHALNLNGQLERHAFGEMQDYQKGVLQSAIETGTSTAILNANDLRRAGDELQKMQTALDTLGPKTGMSAEQLIVAKRQAATGVHVGIIDSMLTDGHYKQARAYFDEANQHGEIDGAAAVKVEKALEVGGRRGEAQKQSDAILAAGGTLTQQREKARGIDDPELRDEVMQRIEHESDVQASATRAQDEARSTSAFSIVDKSHDVATIPPGMWANFNGSTRASLRSYAEHLAKGIPIQTDLPSYYRLMTMAGAAPEKFVNENLLDYRGKFDEPEFKQLAELQRTIRQGDRAKADKDLAGFRTKTELINDSLTQYGFDPKATSDSAQGKAIAQLRRMVDQSVDADQAGGKKVDNAQIQGHIDRILGADVKTPGSWRALVQPFSYDFFDQTKKLIDTTAGDIPAAERTQVEDALRRHGQPISDATVLNLWLQHKVQTSAK